MVRVLDMCSVTIDLILCKCAVTLTGPLLWSGAAAGQSAWHSEHPGLSAAAR